MKRSEAIKLTLMGAGVVALVAYERAPRGGAFADPRQCVEAGLSSAACNTAYQLALARHQRDAPRFATGPECERATDATCQSTGLPLPNGGATNAFAPVMSGYVMNRDCDPSRSECRRSGSASNPAYRSFSSDEPLYESRTRRGRYRALPDLSGTTAPGGATGFTSGGGLGPANVKTGTVSRGGFGRGGFSGGG